MDTNDWIFPHDAKGLNAKQLYGKAIPICKQCPVRSECLAFAVEYKCSSGVWGGLIPDQRKGLKYFSTMREIFKKRIKNEPRKISMPKLWQYAQTSQ